MNGIIGNSGAMERLRAYLPKLAASEASVLITGETGTGKERVAEAIHMLSPRGGAPMVRINCAAIPDGLLESELFGHERGAFTGAHNAYSGKLRLANGGTVFLDEIGEMSLHAQAKVLRVIETREILPVGGSRMLQLNARFIAATNQDLEILVLQGRFRSDLFYRINVARVFLPPLRERREDILDFFDHFLTQFNSHTGLEVTGADARLEPYLLAYDWPGNVRELRNLIEAVFIDPPRGAIGLEHLPEHFRRIFASHVTVRPSERDRVISALSATAWNKSKAAKQLRWSRMTLYRKMSKYNIDEPSL
jgi:transcriptional regulator with PAS, ATPase and Fis domain